MKKIKIIFIIDIIILSFACGALAGSFHTVSTHEIIDKIFTKEYITNYNEYHYEKGFTMPVLEL